MKTIRVTSQNENGADTYNDRIMVMTIEDFTAISDTFIGSVGMFEAADRRFDVLEKIVQLQKEFIYILEERIGALESRNRVLR